MLSFLTYKLAATPLTATRIYQIQKLQRTMILAIIRMRLPPKITILEKTKRRNAEASSWIFRNPWHAKVAQMHTRYDAHIRRSAWYGNWAGLAALHADPALQKRWALTGRLSRMFRGHIAQRWSQSVKLAEIHAFDPHLILTTKSAKYGKSYSLEEDNWKRQQRAQKIHCCVCLHAGCKYDELMRTTADHWACSVHRNVVSGSICCMHSKPRAGV